MKLFILPLLSVVSYAQIFDRQWDVPCESSSASVLSVLNTASYSLSASHTTSTGYQTPSSIVATLLEIPKYGASNVNIITQPLSVARSASHIVSNVVSHVSSTSHVSSVTSSAVSKRGLCYSDVNATRLYAGKSVTWAYNWTPSPEGQLTSPLDFVPMLHDAGMLTSWNQTIEATLRAGARYLLSFNEPDLPTQANMSPTEAAASHIQAMNHFATRAQIGSPAVTNGHQTSPPIGLPWLQQFMVACQNQCAVQFITCHWYDDASNIAYFRSYVADVIAFARGYGISQVWLTEFGARGSDAQVADFLKQAIEYLDEQVEVVRYAYFECSEGILLKEGQLSVLGQIYGS